MSTIWRGWHVNLDHWVIIPTSLAKILILWKLLLCFRTAFLLANILEQSSHLICKKGSFATLNKLLRAYLKRHLLILICTFILLLGWFLTFLHCTSLIHLFTLLVKWENVGTQWSPCQVTNITCAFPPRTWPSLVMLEFVQVCISLVALSARPHCPVPPPPSLSRPSPLLVQPDWFSLKQIVFKQSSINQVMGEVA